MQNFGDYIDFVCSFFCSFQDVIGQFFLVFFEFVVDFDGCDLCFVCGCCIDWEGFCDGDDGYFCVEGFGQC